MCAISYRQMIQMMPRTTHHWLIQVLMWSSKIDNLVTGNKVMAEPMSTTSRFQRQSRVRRQHQSLRVNADKDETSLDPGSPMRMCRAAASGTGATPSTDASSGYAVVLRDGTLEINRVDCRRHSDSHREILCMALHELRVRVRQAVQQQPRHALDTTQQQFVSRCMRSSATSSRLSSA